MSTTPRAAGELVELGRFDIPHVATRRRVRVYLPARQPKRTTPRPLLVLFDGQNAFDDEGSFAGGWHAHRAVDRYAARRANPPVIIAIDHGHEARIRELTPQGQAEAFVTWIAQTLVPRAREEFRLTHEPHGTVLGGSSLGGLAALYAHYRFPEVFGGAMGMSPSLWAGREAIGALVTAEGLPWTSKVYLDAGEREAGGKTLAAAEQLAGLLRARGYTRERLKLRADKRGAHNERAWRRRLPGALRFLFG